MIGTFLGGYICDRLGKRDDRWYLWLPGLATVLAIPFSIYVYLGDDVIRALFVANIPVMLGAFYLGPGFALSQRLVGVRMSALAASVLLFITNLIGLGVGPQLTGIISDVFPRVDRSKLLPVPLGSACLPPLHYHIRSCQQKLLSPIGIEGGRGPWV